MMYKITISSGHSPRGAGCMQFVHTLTKGLTLYFYNNNSDQIKKFEKLVKFFKRTTFKNSISNPYKKKLVRGSIYTCIDIRYFPNKAKRSMYVIMDLFRKFETYSYFYENILKSFKYYLNIPYIYNFDNVAFRNVRKTNKGKKYLSTGGIHVIGDAVNYFKNKIQPKLEKLNN